MGKVVDWVSVEKKGGGIRDLQHILPGDPASASGMS